MGRPKKLIAEKRWSFWLDGQTYANLEFLAKEWKVSKAEVIRNTIEASVKELKREREMAFVVEPVSPRKTRRLPLGPK